MTDYHRTKSKLNHFFPDVTERTLKIIENRLENTKPELLPTFYRRLAHGLEVHRKDCVTEYH